MVQLFKCLRTGARSVQAPNEKPVSGGDLFRLFPPADRCRCGAYLRQGRVVHPCLHIRDLSGAGTDPRQIQSFPLHAAGTSQAIDGAVPYAPDLILRLVGKQICLELWKRLLFRVPVACKSQFLRQALPNAEDHWCNGDRLGVLNPVPGVPSMEKGLDNRAVIVYDKANSSNKPLKRR